MTVPLPQYQAVPHPTCRNRGFQTIGKFRRPGNILIVVSACQAAGMMREIPHPDKSGAKSGAFWANLRHVARSRAVYTAQDKFFGLRLKRD
jgi:hypothetical protein